MKSAIAAAAMKHSCWSGKIGKFIKPESARRLASMNVAELGLYLERHMACPTDASMDCGILDAYYTAAWARTFEMLGLPKNLGVLEIASGDSPPVPFGLDLMSCGQGRYVSANMNRALTERLYTRVRSLGIDIRVIEDDAANSGRYFPPSSFDVVAFQHAINDVIQTILAGLEGLDTVNSNWWELVPEMTRLTGEYYADGRLEEACRPGFLRLIGTCCQLLKPGGFLVFNNTVFEYDLNLGYPLELYRSFVPLARRWIAETNLPLAEITAEEFDRQWWMILKKKP